MTNAPVLNPSGIIDPRWWGITFDGQTDDTAAWVRFVDYLHTVAPTINLVDSGGAAFSVPNGQSLNGIAHVLPQRISILGSGHGGQLVSTSDNTPFFDLTGRHMYMERVHFVAAAGSGARCLDISTLAVSALRDVVCTQPAGDRPAIYHNPSGNGIYSSIIDGLTVFHNEPLRPGFGGAADGLGISVPSFLFEDTGANMNANHFRNWSMWGGFSGSTAPAIQIESDSARTHNNQFDNLNGEHHTAGLLHLLAGSGWMINNPSLHDTAGESITDHVIKLGRNNNGNWGSRQNVITAYDRRDGDLDPGIADIWCDPMCSETAIRGLPERPNQNYVFDFNGSTGIIDGFNPADNLNPDHSVVNAENVIAHGNGSVHRLDTAGVWRTLDRPTGPGPAVWS